MGNVVAIVNRATGARFEGAGLTKNILEYANTAQENFRFEYEGDAEASAVAEAARVDKPTFTAAKLRRMNDGALVDLAISLGHLHVTEEMEKEDVIAVILGSDKAKA